jgi:hypothetical protein
MLFFKSYYSLGLKENYAKIGAVYRLIRCFFIKRCCLDPLVRLRLAMVLQGQPLAYLDLQPVRRLHLEQDCLPVG